MRSKGILFWRLAKIKPNRLQSKGFVKIIMWLHYTTTRKDLEVNIYQSEEFRKKLRKLEYQELKDVKSLYERQKPRPEEELFLIEREFRRREKERDYASYLY